MNELIHIAFSPMNVVYTFLLILVVLYWLMIIIGAMDFGSFDLDFDLDADVDMDVDVDVDADLGASGVGGIAGFLQFFNFGKLPFMVIMSFVILSCWTGSILGNYYIGKGSVLFMMALIIPNFLVALFLTKIITKPLIPVFQKMDAGIEPVDYVGMLCKIVLPATNSKMGQAEVLVDDNRLLINVKLEKESKESLEKGTEALILRKQKNKPYYLIEKFEEKEIF